MTKCFSYNVDPDPVLSFGDARCRAERDAGRRHPSAGYGTSRSGWE